MILRLRSCYQSNTTCAVDFIIGLVTLEVGQSSVRLSLQGCVLLKNRQALGMIHLSCTLNHLNHISVDQLFTLPVLLRYSSH